MAKYNNISDWLRSTMGQNALTHDNLQVGGYDDMLQTGKDVHNLKQALSRYENAARSIGFGRVEIQTNSGGSKIIFRPTDSNLSQQLSDDECPSLDISLMQDGFKIQNNMPTANNPVLVRAANGKVGLASSISVGIDQAADRLREYANTWRKVASPHDLARRIKVTTNMAIDNVTHLNPSMFSKHQIGEYSETLKAQNTTTMALEAQEMLKQQVLTGFYTQSLFQAHAKNGHLQGKNAPKSEQAFARQIQGIMDAARGAKDFNSLNNYVKTNYPWIYNNIWQGDLANLYKQVAGKITQGGKKEGAPGILALSEADIAFGNFENVGRKPKQNLQYLRRTSTYGKRGSAASGQTKLFTQSQRQLYTQRLGKGSEVQDLYYAGELDDKAIQAAYKRLLERQQQMIAAGTWKGSEQAKKFKKQQMEAMKGFGKDASLMSMTANHDFAGMFLDDYLNGEVSKEAIDKIILDKIQSKLAKKHKGNTDTAHLADLAQQEASRLLASTKKEDRNRYDGYVKKAIAQIYDLNSLTKVTGFDRITDESGSLIGFKNITTRRKLDNYSFTARGGATSDFRSVISAFDDELLGWAFEAEGYSLKDIYKNGRDVSGGLKMHIARQKTELSEKTIRSEFKRKSEYIVNRANQDGVSDAQIVEAIKGTPLEGIIKLGSDGQWEVNNTLAEKRFFHSKGSGSTGTPFKMLQEIVKLGQSLGVYEAGEAYSVVGRGKNARIIQNMHLADAMELQVSSPSRYQGMGAETHSGSKFGWRELSSLFGTIGEMEALGIDSQGIQPVRNFANKLADQLAQKETAYKSYTRNIDFLGRTFSNNSTQTKNDLRNTLGFRAVSLADIAGLNTKLDYVNTGIGAGVQLNGDMSNTVEGFLQKIREEEYARLVKQYADTDVLARNGILSARDIQVGVDLGNELIKHTEDGKLYSSGMVMLGLGSMDQNKTTGLFNPDDIAGHNNTIIKVLQQYHTNGSPDRAHLGSAASRKILQATRNIGLAIENKNGSIYERYHTIDGDSSSGYLLLQALNENSSDVFKEIFPNGTAPSMVMSTQDAKAMYRSMWKDGNQRKRLISEYEKLGGTKSSSKKDVIDFLLNYYDINSQDYSGATISDNMFHRSPTIKFASDLLGGNLVFSSDKAFVNQGSLRINADLAASAHGDMDGDRVAFFNAFATGDIDGAKEALMSYYGHLQENQKKIRQGEEQASQTEAQKILAKNGIDPSAVANTGELAKVNSVADLSKRHIRSVAMNAGAKGSGIYGDLLFGVQRILEDEGLSQASAGATPVNSFIANIATNLAHTLYQEGINPKNAKTQAFAHGETVEDYIDNVMLLASQSHTWDSAQGMEYFMSHLEQLGVTKAGGVFKGELIGNLNLNNLGANSQILDLLLQVSTKAKSDIKKNYGTKDERYKRISADLKAIQAVKKGEKQGIDNLSRELVIALLTGEQGLGTLIANDPSRGGSFGERVHNKYRFIPGNGSELSRLINAAVTGGFGDLEKSDPFIQRFIELQTQEAEASGKVASHYMQLKRAKGLADWTTSPSRQTKQIAYNPKYGEAADTREILKYADDIAKQDSEVEELLGHGKSIDELRSMPGFAKYFTAKDYLSRQFNISKDFKVALESTFGGTIAHAAAEYQSRSSDDLTVDDIQDLLRKNGMADLLRQYLKELLGYKEDPIKDPIKEFFVKNIHKGLTNARYVQNNIERNGGKFLGSEMALAGFTNPQDSNGQVALSNQVTDYLYTTVDRNGKTIVHIGDYKNTAGGKPTAANVLQVKDYAHSLQTLHADVQGYTDAQLYLNTAYEGAGNLIAQGWLKRLANAAAFDVREQGITDTDSAEYKRAYNRAYSSRRKDFDSLFTLLSQNQNLGWSGELVTHGDDNTISRHVVDLSNGILNEIFEKSYLNPHPGTEDIISPEDAERLFTNNPNVITKMDTEFAGTTEEYRKFYSKEFDELAKAAQGIAKLKAEIKQLQERNIAELREINPNQDVISSNNTIIEEKTKELNERAQLELDTIKQNLLAKKQVVNLDNEDIGITEDSLQTVINENSDSTYADQLLEQEKYLRARRQYAPNIKHQRYLTEQIQAREFAIQSRYTSESQKADYETELESLRQELQNTIDNFAKINAILKETDGTWKVEDDGKRLEAYHFNENDKKRLSEDAQRQFNISEQQTQMQFYGQAYRMYKKQFDTDDKIWKLDQEISKAQESNDTDRIQLLQLERENLEQQKALYTTMAPDLQNYKGYNAEDEAKAKKKAELESQRARLQYQQKGQGDKGGGFLGIDMYMERWLERMLSGGLIMTSIRMIRKGLHDMVNEAKQLDKVMTNLRIVTKTSAADAKTMMSQYSEQAKILGTSLVEYTQAATEWSRQGYETAEVMGLVKSSTYLSKLGMLDATTAVKDLTSAMKGFKVEASESMSIVDKLTALDVKAATTAGDIAEGLAQFANLASLNGVSIDQASAYVATIADVTQMSGSSVGQAMKTIMSRYGNVKAGAYNQLNVESESEDTSQNLNDVERVLKKLNISIRDNNLEFKDFDEILDEIAIKWETLDSVSKKAIANAFAGKFDVCPNM